MDWKFAVVPFDPTDFPVLKGNLLPIGQAGLDACREWLDRNQRNLQLPADCAPPSNELLTTDLPQNALRTAEFLDDDFGPRIAFSVPERSPRFVDPAAFCLMRVLALPGRDCEWWFDRSTEKNLPPKDQRWYLKYSREKGGGIWGTRILADARRGDVIRQYKKRPSGDHLGHYDLRLSNLVRTSRRAILEEGKPMREPFRGRLEAINVALRNFGEGVRGLSITQDEYRELIVRCFQLLDDMHANDIKTPEE